MSIEKQAFTHKITRVHKTEKSGINRTDNKPVLCHLLNPNFKIDDSLTYVAESLSNIDDTFRYIETSPIVDIHDFKDHKIVTTYSGSVYKVEENV